MHSLSADCRWTNKWFFRLGYQTNPLLSTMTSAEEGHLHSNDQDRLVLSHVLGRCSLLGQSSLITHSPLTLKWNLWILCLINFLLKLKIFCSRLVLISLTSLVPSNHSCSIPAITGSDPRSKDWNYLWRLCWHHLGNIAKLNSNFNFN